METDLQAKVTFHLTGRTSSGHLDAIEGLGLRPALFAGYRDLTALRYDFPVVLVRDGAEGRFMLPLSAVMDSVLEKVAHGPQAERIHHHVLRQEQAIRSLCAKGVSGTLLQLWDQAAQNLVAHDKQLADSLDQAKANLKVDGDVVDCGANTAPLALRHVWSLAQTRREREFTGHLNQLVLKLSEILKADFIHSSEGKTAQNLQAAFGSGPMDRFDFAAMSQILGKSAHKSHLPERRRLRLENLLAVLRAQQFFPANTGEGLAPWSFVFEDCTSAINAWRERLPKLIELARALAMAELETKGEYNEARHDALFEHFASNGLDTRELRLFPDYLVLLNTARMSARERDLVFDILSADLPMKILVQTDDVIEEATFGSGHLAFALRSRQLASMALGMNSVYVLQAPASGLVQLRQALERGLDFPGPTLYSVFSGASDPASDTTGDLPAYLVAAAAQESRVFPAFVYDPAAGDDWASRFSMAGNPQPELDWPLHDLGYQDSHCHAVSERLAFTLVDFVLCDSRYSQHFARVPHDRWGDTLVSAQSTIASDGQAMPDHVPYVLALDSQMRLQRLVVDEKLIREARRCRSMWHSLQELGGIHNSHADRLLAREQAAWAQAQQAVATAQARPALAPQTPAPQDAPPEQAQPEPEMERSPDEAYIETARCSTCNECTQINNKMFAYDANQQAYIKDITAGTYAQLVEAAESCQVSVIHPGKPRNPKEPDLDELLKRADVFA